MSIQHVDSIPNDESIDLSLVHQVMGLDPSQHPAAFASDHEFHSWEHESARLATTFSEGAGMRYKGDETTLMRYADWLGYVTKDQFMDALSDAMDAHEATFDAEEAAELATEGIYLKGSTPDIYVSDATDNNQTVLINTEGY